MNSSSLSAVFIPAGISNILESKYTELCAEKEFKALRLHLVELEHSYREEL